MAAEESAAGAMFTFTPFEVPAPVPFCACFRDFFFVTVPVVDELHCAMQSFMHASLSPAFTASDDPDADVSVPALLLFVTL